MKRLLLIIPIFALVLVLTGCNVQDMIRNYMDETIEGFNANYRLTLVSDSPGLNFTGKYAVVTAAYDPETQSLDFIWNLHDAEGQIPPEGYMEYTAHDAVAVVGAFQKRAGNTTLLRVEVWRDADLMEHDETTEPSGVVFAGGIR